jgi:hypothetical protein
MAEEPKRRFRATDVITGAVEKAPPAPALATKPLRKRVTLHLTQAQIAALEALYRQINAPGKSAPERIEKSELGGLAIELLARLLPPAQSFDDISQISGYLDIWISGHPDNRPGKAVGDRSNR